MVKVTGTVTDPIEEAIVTEPLYVPTPKLPGLAETETEAGVTLLGGLAVSHDPPLVVAVVTVKLMAVPVVLLTERD
jgi:hypothetical protein